MGRKHTHYDTTNTVLTTVPCLYFVVPTMPTVISPRYSMVGPMGLAYSTLYPDSPFSLTSIILRNVSCSTTFPLMGGTLRRFRCVRSDFYFTYLEPDPKPSTASCNRNELYPWVHRVLLSLFKKKNLNASKPSNQSEGLDRNILAVGIKALHGIKRVSQCSHDD